jgi:hypothetical protein
MGLKLIHQGSNDAFVSVDGDGSRVIKNSIKWPGTFAKVESLVFSPQGDLFACVIESLSQGENYGLISAERSSPYWDGAHCIYRDGIKIGQAKFSQTPVFVGDHYLWIRSRDGYQNISYANIMCGEERAAISGRGIDEPRRLTIDADVLKVNGFDGIYDEDKLKHVPFFAVIEYHINLSSHGLSLEEKKNSYCAWSD